MKEFTEIIQTEDGRMPVEVFHPELSDTYPGVIFYMDVFGIREELRDMCRRIASAGYAVFMPSMYYRKGNPTFLPPNQPDDSVSDDAQSLNQSTSVQMSAADTTALIDHVERLDILSIPVWGTVGYCMGGRHAVAGAAANPKHVRAAISLHGGQLVNDTETSTHRVIDKVNGEVYFGFAKNDHVCPDEHQKIIQDALEQSATTGRIDYYDARHGWTFPERHCFNKQAAELAWENVFHIFRTQLWTEMTN